MTTRSSIALAAALVCMAAAGCQPERYFGPYSLSVPTALQERSAGRTFLLPLDSGDQDQQLQFDECQAAQPDRTPPCRCEFPVLSIDEQEVRVDYRLTHNGGSPANVSVWLGTEEPAGAPAPNEVPDLPRVRVWAEHLHRLLPGAEEDATFLEDELRQLDLDWSLTLYPDCESPDGARPAPLSWIVGLSLQGEETAAVGFEVVARVRTGG